MNMVTKISLLLLQAVAILGDSPWHNPNCADGRVAMVHLFEWKWPDIEAECVNFLGPMGYCGVQVSPPQEHVMVHGRPWWERYQPVSYRLESRSGSREQFISMVKTCNNNGVRIYVDAIINHMTGMGRSSDDEPASGGSEYDADEGHYPAVPFTMSDFNTCDGCTGCCCINSWTDHVMVRNCRLVGLIDLNPKVANAANKIVEYMNDLIDIGVAGFRVDAAKHMWPDDIEMMWGRLDDLNTEFFPAGTKPYMALEVIDLNQQGEVNVHEYKHLGQVTEFRYCVKISDIAKHPPSIRGVFDPGWGMLDPDDAFVFVDNHDNQRGHGGGGSTLTYKNRPDYTMGQAITLGWAHSASGGGGYGHPRVMSSFDFGSDTERGPPADDDGNTDDVIIIDGACQGEWVCEHRWPAIAGMASWAKATSGGAIENEYDNGGVFAFSRGGRGFVSYNNPGTSLQTGLPAGDYCNVAQGCATESGCVGQTVSVGGDGMAMINIEGPDPILAIHVEAMAGSNQCTSSGPPVTPDPTVDPPPTTEPTEPTSPTEPPSTTTREPDQDEWQRTIIYMRGETQPGQDLFLRGGIDHDQREEGCTEDAATSQCAIDIDHISLGTGVHFEKYNDWRVGDLRLDWYGEEAGQGSWQGMPAEGTPLVWTTDDSSHPAYQPDNLWGEHYWKVEFYMDCDEAEDGWFEVKGLGRGPGGILWEDDVTQGTCTGQGDGDDLPYTSNNHFAKCGARNVFEWNSNDCIISEIDDDVLRKY